MSQAPTPSIRDATAADLPVLLRLLGQLNETLAPLCDEHLRAFEAIQADTRQRLLVVERDGSVIATASLVVVPNIGHGGLPYAIVENVVVDGPSRGQGVGAQLMRFIIDDARTQGCYKVALTSRKTRSEAHRFYERMGFARLSEGFRIDL